MRRRSSNWLQKGCRTVIPVLRLGIHPEMERPAILKRSMPSTAGVTIGMPPARVGNEADFQSSRRVYQTGSGFSRNLCTSAHVGGQMLPLEGKIRSLGRAFTNKTMESSKEK